MLILHLPLHYVLGAAIWLLLLVLAFVGIVALWRAGRRRRGARLLARVGLSCWMVLAVLTACELGFAALFSESDALNFTNVAKRWHAIHVAPQLDALGLRNRRPLAAMLAPGPRRIAFVGDSFTFGHGVPRIEDRFSDRIEAALEQVHAGRWQVDNFGVPGNDVTAVVAQAQQLFEQGYRPAVLVYVWQVNDLERLDERTWTGVRGLAGNRSDCWLITETYFLNWFYYRVLLRSGAVTTYFDDLRAAYAGPAFARAAEALDRLQAACTAHGAELRLAVFPFVHALGKDYAFRDAHRRLAEHARERGVRFVDLEPLLSQHADEGLIVNPRDTHPNERGHELAAQAMRTQLLDDLFANDGGR